VWILFVLVGANVLAQERRVVESVPEPVARVEGGAYSPASTPSRQG
jgi:hypothetical protein